MRIGVKPGQWGWSYPELEASWQAAEECGFELVSCFDHVTDAPQGLAAWNAPSLLTAMAVRTSRLRLAVDVVSTPLRHPFLLAGQVAVAQAASDGRVELGLGAGSGLSRLDGVALGRPFPPLRERRRRLARMCQVLPALWRGERVTDETLGIHDASLGPISIEPPPIIVGGRSPETIEIAARYADGWNAVTADADEFRDLARVADEHCARLGRRAPLAKAAQIFVGQIDRRRARELVHRLQEAGAETAIFVLHEERGPDEVRRLAEEVLE